MAGAPVTAYLLQGTPRERESNPVVSTGIAGKVGPALPKGEAR